MYKTDEEVEYMLNHPNNGSVRIAALGVGNYFNRTTPHKEHILRTVEEKSDIAVLGTLLGNTPAGQMMNVNPARVSAYKNGGDGNGRKNPLLVKENNDRLSAIRSRALDKVELFMEMLTTEKTLKMKGRDIGSLAEKFVNVYDKLSPKVPVNIEKANIVFYAPRVKESNDYPVIEVESVES